MHFVELVVADPEKNGFVSLARWLVSGIDAGRACLQKFDALMSSDCEPDIDRAEVCFVLDLHDSQSGEPNQIETSARPLPLQLASRIAPIQVTNWLYDRPCPDALAGQMGPWLEGEPQ